MSAKTLAFAAEYPGLSGNERSVLLTLCNMAHKKRGNTCFPGQKYIAAHSGVSLRTAVTALAKLERVGAIKRKPRRNTNGHRSSDLYTICLDATVAPDLSAKSAKAYMQNSSTNPYTPYGVDNPSRVSKPNPVEYDIVGVAK